MANVAFTQDIKNNLWQFPFYLFGKLHYAIHVTLLGFVTASHVFNLSKNTLITPSKWKRFIDLSICRCSTRSYQRAKKPNAFGSASYQF